jgi:membrane protease YdiL (CAAX protease family)
MLVWYEIHLTDNGVFGKGTFMPEQQYIFKKQIICLMAIIIILLIALSIKVDSRLIYGIIIYLAIILGITFIPSLPRLVRYPKWLHLILYESPFLISLFFVEFTKIREVKLYIIFFIFTIIYILVLLFWGRKQFLDTISDIRSAAPISIPVYIFEMSNILLAVIVEEVCFRGFFVGYFMERYGAITIFMSALLFTFTHYLNRWASKIFTIKIYFLQFFVGIGLGTAYFYTRSVLLVSVCHLVFNSSRIINITKRILRSNKTTTLFNDYE